MQTTTGLFTVSDFNFPRWSAGDEFLLCPFGDVHRHNPLHNKDVWTDWKNRYSKRQNAFFIGMGDYSDLLAASERMALLHGKFHASTRSTLDEKMQTIVDADSEELGFMRNRLVGLIEGNHYYEFQDGTTSTQRMCRNLKCRYLGVSAFIRLGFRRSTSWTSIAVWAHHGKGASRLMGGSLNRVEQMAEAADADIYMMGHDHKAVTGKTCKLQLVSHHSKLRLTHRTQLMIRTGSFLNGYVDGKNSYVADAALKPTNLGAPQIRIVPKRRAVDGVEDVHIEMFGEV